MLYVLNDKLFLWWPYYVLDIWDCSSSVSIALICSNFSVFYFLCFHQLFEYGVFLYKKNIPVLTTFCFQEYSKCKYVRFTCSRWFNICTNIMKKFYLYIIFVEIKNILRWSSTSICLSVLYSCLFITVDIPPNHFSNLE